MTIRSATLEDLETLYEFEQGIISAERPYDPTLRNEKINYYDLKALILSSEAEVLVGMEGNEITGSGYVQIREAKPYLRHVRYAYIGFMFVQPDHRGKGVIQRITDHLLAWAKLKGLQEVRLEVYDQNHSAVRAYEKAGFEKYMVEMRREI